ncbi:MAG: hypothetical protein HOO67_04820 [Candidatus Peribacteraceae bacterium]|nr:hypothetical protein [Candidatus Peribacteraceae bacterium]
MTRAKLVIVLLLAVVLGFAAGWWLFGLWYTAPVSPVLEQASSSSALPPVTTGYCCRKAGESCVQVENANDCFAPGGVGFNTRQATCNNFCSKIGSLPQ